MARNKLTPEVLTAAAAAPQMIDVWTKVPDARAAKQEWQGQAWVYYDLVPEIRSAADLFGNALARIRLFVAKRPKSNAPPLELTEGNVAGAMNEFVDATGTQRGLLRDLAVNIFVTGEAYIVGGDHWEVRSIDEIRFTGTSHIGTNIPQAQIREAPYLTPIDVPLETLVMRVWKPHPRWSRLADSAMRTVQDDCEKLLMISKAEKAAVRSRFASSGILFIPQELVPPAQQTQDRNPNPIDANPLYKGIAEALMAASKDEGHPSNLVPIMIFGPAEYGSAIRYITLERPLDKLANALRESAIKRIAVAIDLPTDFLLGLGDLNHWTAWVVKEDAFSAHFQPFVELICDSLTTGYLNPVLNRAGITDASDYIVWYDASKLIVQPDKADAVIQAYDRLAASDEYLREALGVPQEAKPSDEERAKRVGLKLADPQMAITGVPTPPPDPMGGGAGGRPNGSLTGHTPPGSTVGGVNANPQKTSTMRRVSSGPSSGAKPGSITASAAESVSRQLALLDISLTNQVRVLAEAGLKRTAERLGARARSKLTATESAQYKGVDNALLPEYLNMLRMQEIGLNEDNLLRADLSKVAAEAAEYGQTTVTTALSLIESNFDSDTESIGYKHLLPIVEQSRISAEASFLATFIDLLRERLYAGIPVSAEGEASVDGLQVPPGDIRKAIQIAGGGSTSASIFPVGAATGRIVNEYLQQLGVGIDGWLWVYSPNLRRPHGSFNPHIQLDGLVFRTETDEELRVPDEKSYRFLKREYMSPGDHRGCLCVVTPWIGPNFGEARPI
jgi:hypothetical protein